MDQFLILIHQWMHTQVLLALRQKRVKLGMSGGKSYFKLALLQKLKVSIINYPISPSDAGCLRHHQ